MACEVCSWILKGTSPVTIVIVCYFLTPLMTCAEGDTTSELRKQIFAQYNKTVSPGFETKPSDVGTIFSLTRLSLFDDPSSTLTVEGFLHVNWFDFRLTWNDDPIYGNISWISANVDDIWKPNINVFNRGRARFYNNTQMFLFISQHGQVWWTVSGDFLFVCEQEELRWYPLDTHTCRLSVGSLYPQDAFSMTILYQNKQTMHGTSSEGGIANPHWNLLSIEHTENVTSVAMVMFYPTDDFVFVIRRHGWTMLAAFLPLMTCFMFLSWSTFALPACGELLSKRLIVSTTIQFLSSILLLVMIKTVPGIGTKPPVMVKVYASVVVLVLFTCLHNIFITDILQKSSKQLQVLRKLPKQVLRILGLLTREEPGGLLENEEVPQEEGPEQFQLEPAPEDSWNLVGKAYDRLHFFLQVTAAILAISIICLG